MKYYIDGGGKFMGGWDDDPPEGAIEVSHPPEYADQVWLFPEWGSSRLKETQEEAQWREQEMPAAEQNVTALTYGADDIPGSVVEWQKYWLALRKWTEANPDFPDSSKRPVAPT